jgi:hypothetical protein
MDCSTAIATINTKEKDRSALVHLVTSIKYSIGESDVLVKKVDRSQNGASHNLAHLGRTSGRTQFGLEVFHLKLRTM